MPVAPFIAEIYLAIWRSSFERAERNPDQHDAYCIAAWLSAADRTGTLSGFLKPDLTPPERTLAQVEGWILGVHGKAARASDEPISRRIKFAPT